MDMMKAKGVYDSCAHIKITKPEYQHDENITKELSTNFRTLPSFEKTVFDHTHIKHYSLNRNERLKCRWNVYKKNIETRVFAPFQFPSTSDLHFYNCVIQYLPKYRNTDNRMKLKLGPGVDQFGQMPIPYELLMKRGRIVKEDDKEPKKQTNNVGTRKE